MADDGFEEEKDEEDGDNDDGDDDDENFLEDEWVFVLFFLLIFLFLVLVAKGGEWEGVQQILTFCFSSPCLEDQPELHVISMQLRVSLVSCESLKLYLCNKFLCTLFIFG